ncbi:type I restriction endonuclease [Mesomycoplasma neurolyticum]|uniref:type I site-specific deoxyribonuclease n=1 Tax=Mesomycoplasma neurolyticum TaxID=2120 RepID=A0A449A6J6_9BACT|nr:type I restriction endonuclease [Mesomycoplasma neurolyticum]VEU59856.1 Type I restriction enzyme EcoR124II R protein [Mesomycoplasma neurolyticum]
MKQNEKWYENDFVKKLVEKQEYIKLQGIKDTEGLLKIIFIEIERLNSIKLKEENKQKLKELFTLTKTEKIQFAQWIWNFDTITIPKENSSREQRLKLIDWENWENNNFYVLQQFSTKNKETNKTNIFDSLILINGFPLIFFEFKDKNVKIKKAISDIKNDYKNVLNSDVLRFVQILVASNFEKIKLMSNNDKEEKKLNLTDIQIMEKILIILFKIF